MPCSAFRVWECVFGGDIGVNGIVTIEAEGQAVYNSRAQASTELRSRGIVAIGYYARAHRGANEMAARLARDESRVRSRVAVTSYRRRVDNSFRRKERLNEKT
ncbi:MAG: hypothetical protein KAY65_13180 [Planctomycetes bacterium]|nr:hypothetical protein [Planctomycetota bacterium]